MGRGEVNETLNDDSHDGKMERQGDGLNVTLEESEWADLVGRNLWEDSQCPDNLWEDSEWAEEVSNEDSQCGDDLWADSQWADELSQNLKEFSEWADELRENLNIDFRDQKMKMPRRDEESNALPEELVENIIARVPFPFVFKARVLSKSWLARLSPISSQDDAEKKRLAISFQKQIREQSVNWKTFCPVLARAYCPAYKEDLLSPVFSAYDRTSQTWLRLPSLSFLPENLRNSNRFDGHIQQIEGALLLFSKNLLPCDVRSKRLYVANILTRSWKELPPCPHNDDEGDYLGYPYLSHTSDKYEVIMIYSCNFDFLDIYDSNSAAWSTVELPLSIHSTLFPSQLELIAYLDGVLYLLRVEEDPVNPMTVNSLQVLALNVTGETPSAEFDIVAEINNMGWIGTLCFVEKLFCNFNLLILIVEPPTYEIRDEGSLSSEIQVVKVDLQSRQFVGLTPGPCVPREAKPSQEVVTDGDFIFTHEEPEGGKAIDGDRVLAYNVHEDKWISLPYRARIDQATIPNLWVYKQELQKRDYESRIRSSFRPGLNPFVAV